MRALFPKRAAIARGRGRWPTRLAAALTLCLALSGIAHGEPSRAQPATPHRPNIVFILVDDLDAMDLSRFPNIWNLLVRQGATFSRFFATNPGAAPPDRRSCGHSTCTATMW